MKNFIPVMRAKRLQEMKVYDEKGYVIHDRKHYIMTETVQMDYMGQKYMYGVQVTQDEIYFYIIRDKANMYLSIVELYNLIRNLDESDRTSFVKSIKRQLAQKKSERENFQCDGLSYKLVKPVDIVKDRANDIPQTGIQIMRRELFLLILLIQEKSNALFYRSTGQKEGMPMEY